jgi:K(+)-stimulated pyrophosphate-energized sodium pump
MDSVVFLAPVLGLVGLVTMAVKSAWVNKQPGGDKTMTELAGHISNGAMAFLRAEWKLLSYFVVIAAILLAWSGTTVENSSPVIAISFIIGAVFSATAGYIGMNIATKANVRTTQAARSSLAQALKVSFTGGSVMGLGVAGLAVLGLGSLFILFYHLYVKSAGGDVNGLEMEKALEVLAGFSLGAESIALFARVGGGIYTKAADVGADLVGKVEAGIPEDDVRNPATIADNVGDNVGDVAGMGADLFGSYVATILATMVLGREIKSPDNFGGIAPILLPMVIAGLGLVFSIIGMMFVKIKDEKSSVQNALNLGNWSSIILTAAASWFAVNWLLPDGDLVIRDFSFTRNGVFGSIILGLVVGAIMSMLTEYYTSMGKRPVLSIIKQSGTGHATNIIGGLSVGMESTAIPMIVLAGGIYGSYELAGLYGVSIAAAGMMATTAMQLAIDAFGPIADNAGGIAEMSQLPEEVRHRTDNLDAVGNTTAATGKGFAIASAALTSLALFAAFCGVAGIDHIDIYKANVLSGLFVGAMIPFIFSSLAIAAVGRAAMDMVNEVRRQFREIPGIMEYKAKPEYEKCVAISTQASIREMIAPGAIALIVPIIVGFLFGPEVLGGLLAGVTVSGVLMGMFQNNAGGAWDNAKKSFEKGVEIDGQVYYKKSEPHKASVTGDTVGDPFKDTSGPSMNILIKLMSIVSLIIAPHISVKDHVAKAEKPSEQKETTAAKPGSYIVNTAASTLRWTASKANNSNHFGTVALAGGKVNITIEGISGSFEMDMAKGIVIEDISDAKDNAELLEHLRDSDFFNTSSYPLANLEILSSNKLDNGQYQVNANLTLKGITKDISFPVNLIEENGQTFALANLNIDRTRWGIMYKSKTIFSNLADSFILDEVKLEVKLSLQPVPAS